VAEAHLSDGPTTLPTTTDRLTARELQVWRPVAAGSTNEEIAGALGVSEHPAVGS